MSDKKEQITFYQKQNRARIRGPSKQHRARIWEVGNRADADVDADVRVPRKPKNADADAALREERQLREERPPRNPDAAADADVSKFIIIL